MTHARSQRGSEDRAMGPGDRARLYHRLSSFTFVPYDQWSTPLPPPPNDDPRIVQDFVPYVADRLPPDRKAYPPGCSVAALPRAWPRLETTATDVLAGCTGPASSTGLDLPGLARLLHLSAGIVRTRAAKPPFTRPWLFRAAGSAGGRFPLELYVSARGVDGLADGVHWYDAIDHALVRVGPPASGGATALIVTGIPWRTSWKYAERGFRHIYWDAGTMLAQTLALAGAAGLGPLLWTRLPDAEIAGLVGADGVQEFPLAVVGLGAGVPAIQPTSGAIRGSVADDPLEFPLITATQHAGDGERLGDPWPAAAALPGPVPASADIETVILRRGSARTMDGAASVPRAVFEFALAASLRGARQPHFVAVHAVEGVAPGLYRWPDMRRPIRPGNLRDELLLVCWDMDLGRDAAFVVLAAADLAGLDDCGYREAQLEAGIVEGRLHLAAYALGIGASGMSFLDDDLEALLGPPHSGLLITCVGVPTYRHKDGGDPGAPVSIITPPSGETPRS